MLTQLNEEQVTLLPKVRDYWINLALHSTKYVRREQIEDYVAHIYEKWLNKKKPRILIFDSFWVSKFFVGLSNWNQVRNQVEIS